MREILWFRRAFLIGVSGFFCLLLWAIRDGEGAVAVALADTLPWCVVITLMLPSERLKVRELLSGMKIWKGDDDERK